MERVRVEYFKSERQIRSDSEVTLLPIRWMPDVQLAQRKSHSFDSDGKLCTMYKRGNNEYKESGEIIMKKNIQLLPIFPTKEPKSMHDTPSSHRDAIPIYDR